MSAADFPTSEPKVGDRIEIGSDVYTIVDVNPLSGSGEIIAYWPQLRKAGIKVTMFIDSAAAIALEKENRKDKIYANKIFLGADALLSEGIINKIGSRARKNDTCFQLLGSGLGGSKQSRERISGRLYDDR